MLMFDFGVILSSVFIIGLDMAMYTLVSVFISARVIDFVIEGLNASKAVTIVSNRPQELAGTIVKKMDRGVTILTGRGGYTGKTREVLYVVVGRNELPKLKQIVHQIDPQALSLSAMPEMSWAKDSVMKKPSLTAITIGPEPESP